LPSGQYAWAPNPYLLKQISQAALAELERRKKASQVNAPVKPDPEALKSRQEALALKAEASKMLKDASLRAAKLISDSQASVDQARRDAEEKGHAEGLARGLEEGGIQGRKKGEEEGRASWKEAVDRWQQILTQTVEEKQAYLSDREQVLVKLAVEIASKVLARQVKADPDNVLELVRQAIRKATDRSRLSIHLNPEDINRALLADESSFRLAEGVKQIEFLPDNKVMPGGVLIETPSGTIDARIETQLEEVTRNLLEIAYHGD
jgi:flagellar assembly protein FliH